METTSFTTNVALPEWHPEITRSGRVTLRLFMVANSTVPNERSNSSIGTTSPPKPTKDSGKPDPVIQAGSATTPDLAIGSKSSQEPIRHRLPTIRGEGRRVCSNRDAPRRNKSVGRTTSPNNRAAAKLSTGLEVINPSSRTAARPSSKLEPTSPNSIADALRRNVSE